MIVLSNLDESVRSVILCAVYDTESLSYPVLSSTNYDKIEIYTFFQLEV